MKKGKLIVVDGGEGSGKTTLLQYLRGVFDGGNVVFTREPGGTVVAERIRNLVLSAKKDLGEVMETETELLLFLAARIEHLKKLIIPSLEVGKHVITDRFSLSTYAYQVWARERKDMEETFYVLDAFARGGLICGHKWQNVCEPDLWVLLEINPETGLHRAKSRKDTNRFEEETIRFHERVADGLRRAVCGKKHAVIIDASKSIPEVRREVLAHIKQVLQME